MRALNALKGISSVTEIANSVPAIKVESRRCLACRLPEELQEEIARDRFRGWATFAQLVKKLSSKGFKLSDSAVRRHFRHVERDRYFDGGEGQDGGGEAVSTPLDGLLEGAISEEAVCEALVRVLLERTQRLEKQQRVVRDHSQAERLATRSLKTMGMLERTLDRLGEARKPREEMKKRFRELVGRACEALGKACRDAMAEHVRVLTMTRDEYVGERLHPELLAQRVSRFQEEWPNRLTAHVRAAMSPIFREAGAIR